MVVSGLSPSQFVQRWAGRPLNESAAAQSHFNDLCELLGVPKPTDNRVTDSDYGFEARTDISASGVYATTTGEDGLPFYRVTTGSGPGFADVWKRGCFGWEYKTAGKYRTLNDALAQLRIYAPSLGNPPLLIVSDIDRYEIHTNFTNYPATKVAFGISDLAKPSDEWKKQYPRISPLEALRKVFDDIEWFRPKKTREAITAEFAEDMGELAIALRESGNDPHAVAHLIMQIVFCFFAEDIGLLPRGLFADLINKCTGKPAEFPHKARTLFKAMEFGGHFGSDTIEYFNGGLFKDVERDPAIHIDSPWLGKLLMVAKKDWDSVDPSIFGTLFERSLDPGKRSQIGAHYTSRDDIMLIVEPVVMQPLRRRWVDVQKDVAEWLEQRREAGGTTLPLPVGEGRGEGGNERARSAGPALTPNPSPKGRGGLQRQRNLSKKIEDAVTAFVDHLGSIKILDPACGSGNFLYVTIQQLLDLENEVRAFAARPEINVAFLPRVQPRQLMGIDVNDYACELARVSIWIGYLQWLHANGSAKRTPPILDPLDTIEHRDAILKWGLLPLPVGEGRGEGASGSRAAAANALTPNPSPEGRGEPTPIPVWQPGAICLGRAEWPKADFIIGNPPFLGSKLFRKWGLSDNYLQSLFDVYDLPNTSDLCCYWFELGRRALLAERVERVGLLATQNIRGNENRTVLERIKADGDIFMAWSDRPWILEGAAVHVSLIGFDDGAEASRMLDGQPVSAIHANLTSSLNIKLAQPLIENEDLAFQGPVKVGAFDIDPDTAKQFLSDTNPHNRSNTDVIKIWIRGEELTKRVPRVFIIDFGDLEEDEASLYQAPFDHVVTHVRSKRLRTSDALRRKYWWRLGRSGEDFRAATRSHDRYLVTCQTAKHRIFSWVISRSLPAQTVIAFGRSDDYSLGVLQSSIHLVWGARQGTRLETRPRYTPTTSFETFPLPWPPGKEPSALPSPLGAGRGAGGEGASGSRAAAGNALTPNPSPAGRGGPTLTPALSQKERELEEAIASAAKELNKLRENWLNPPEWIKPIEDAVDRFEDFAGVPDEAKPLLRQSAIMARAAKDAKLKKRTLTNLYNERPGWLKIAHRKLDEAVLAAYRDVDAHAPNPWDVAWAEAYEPFGAGEITINRKGKKPDSPEVIAAKEVAIAQRKIIDEKILANLLRLNQERAAKEAMAQA